jgi:G3E family GTPase
MLTGFLGSGKTTFLNHLIEHYVSRNKFVAVIQNEIGPTGLDARLLEDQYAVLEMDEGCVCCSLAGELRKGIIRITEEIKPDLIILETTGLANPYNITGDLDTISDLVRLENIITLVDGENFLSMELATGIITDQIRSAYTLVINKCDMISNLQADIIVKNLGEINPSARIFRCRYGDVNIADIMQPDYVSEPKEARRCSWIHADEGHHQTHADENIRARKITLSEPVDRVKLLANIEVIAKHAFRIKGVLDFQGDTSTWLLQTVNGIWELEEMKHHIPDERFLIVISKDDKTVNLLDKLLLTKTINYEKINELSCCADGDCIGSL